MSKSWNRFVQKKVENFDIKVFSKAMSSNTKKVKKSFRKQWTQIQEELKIATIKSLRKQWTQIQEKWKIATIETLDVDWVTILVDATTNNLENVIRHDDEKTKKIVERNCK